MKEYLPYNSDGFTKDAS